MSIDAQPSAGPVCAGDPSLVGVTSGRIACAAGLLCVAALALFWPGVAVYDTVAQYRQAVSGAYDDWHPPIMVALWHGLRGIGLTDGATPMLAVQMLSYWAGLGLLAAALAAGRGTGRDRSQARPRAAIAVLLVGALPLFLGWQGVVLKDAQMVGILLFAIGLVGWWRLRARRVPVAAWGIVALCCGYALLVRANAVFAVVPLLAMLAPISPLKRGGIALVGTLLALALAPVVNHAVLGAARSGVERTQAIYDLAGIAARVPDGAATGLRPDEIAAIVARHCASPFFWDPLGDEAHCGASLTRLQTISAASLYATLAVAIVNHPVAYAAHRLAHLNSTDRWLVPLDWPNAAPPAASEPNTLGLKAPGRLAGWWQAMARWIAESPAGWPIVWIVVAITACTSGAGRSEEAADDAARKLGTALLVSALVLEASFAVLSIASDLRYHLWPMLATALGVILRGGRTGSGRNARATKWICGVAMLVVIGGGITARAMLPRPPQTYAGMLG